MNALESRNITSDTDLAEELELFAENHEPIYAQYLTCIKNVQRRIAKGTYDHTLAQKLWLYWIESAVSEYKRTIDSTARFSPAVRKIAARSVADSAFAAIENGEFA